MKVTEHGSLDMSRLLRVMSEILSDRYRTQITVYARSASITESALSGVDNVRNSSRWK